MQSSCTHGYVFCISTWRFPYPYFRLIDDVGSLQGNGAKVEVAPGPEGCHHIGDNDIECFVIAGIHEEVCGAAKGPQRLLSPHTFIIITTIATFQGETRRRDELEWMEGDNYSFENNKSLLL